MIVIKKYILMASVFLAVVLMCIYLFPQIVMFIVSMNVEDPLLPEITYGEFPFSIECEINGKITTVEDVIICEFEGIGFGDNGKFLKWKKRLASNGEENLMLVSEKNKQIFCAIGDAAYYMGEKRMTEPLIPKIYVEEYKDSITISSSDPEELEKYNIRIISYKFSQPIENKFK